MNTVGDGILAFFGSVGLGEWMVIGLVALLVFGSRLPSVARSLGKSVVEFKKGLNDIKDEIKSSGDDSEKNPPTHGAPPAG